MFLKSEADTASMSKKFSFNFPKVLHSRKQGDNTQVMKCEMKAWTFSSFGKGAKSGVVESSTLVVCTPRTIVNTTGL